MLCGERLLIPVPTVTGKKSLFLEPAFQGRRRLTEQQLVRETGRLIPELELSTVTKFLGEVNTCPLQCGANVVCISGLELKAESPSE